MQRFEDFNRKHLRSSGIRAQDYLIAQGNCLTTIDWRSVLRKRATGSGLNFAQAGEMRPLIGTAGWTVPKEHHLLFPASGEHPKASHLERYAGRLNCVEINSSFHRPHRRSTWERWAAVTPEGFRFAVKAPKTVTHAARLVNTGGLLLEFFTSVQGLGKKLGPVLVQLPPTLAFDEATAHEFFTTLRELHAGAVALEPRHLSWFASSADRLLCDFEIARVAADPPKGSELAARPGGWGRLRYWRLHGAPRTYYSKYDQSCLSKFAAEIRKCVMDETWVIFDNTAMGHAAVDALWMVDALR